MERPARLQWSRLARYRIDSTLPFPGFRLLVFEEHRRLFLRADVVEQPVETVGEALLLRRRHSIHGLNDLFLHDARGALHDAAAGARERQLETPRVFARAFP